MPNLPLFFTLMVLISCLGQVTGDLYLPSLPAISTGLQTTSSLTKLSVSFFMLGFSVSQLVYGPISDAIGRRKPLLFGLSLCLIAGILCIFSPNIYFLITARLFQGLGAGAGMALSRSMMRDRFDGSELAKFGSYLGILNVFVLASAPVIGGYLQHYVGWRSNFLALAIYAFVVLVLVLNHLPETSVHIHPESITFKRLKANCRRLLTNREFVGYGLCVFLAYGGVLAWLTVGPLLLQNVIGLSPVQFGWLAILIGLAFVLGGLFNALFVNRFGHLNMLRFGVVLKLLAGLIMLYFGLMGILNFTVVIMPLFLFLFGCAFIFPNTFAGALIPFATIAGLAGAVFGFLQTLGGSLSSFLMSYFPDNTQIPIATIFVFYAILAIVVSFFFLDSA